MNEPMENLKRFYWETRYHIKTIWYFLRTGQYGWFKTKARLFGPKYDWYDGPHYAFHFLWFAISSDDYKDRAKGESRLALIRVISKLLNKKFWPY